jgi:hypothetical protein
MRFTDGELLIIKRYWHIFGGAFKRKVIQEGSK